jgi:NAD(P)H-dependent FMN reductase
MIEVRGGPGQAAATAAEGTGSPSSARVGVIVGSTRANRICPEIARLVREHMGRGSLLSYTLVDLAEIGLPFLDEPVKPALGRYAHEHTRSWSRLVSSFEAFVLVFPQYNWGYPAPLKNALDFLYAEWRDKPAALVTYGTRGGGRAAEQMRTVLQGLHMRTVGASAEIKVSAADVDAEGRLVDAQELLAGYVTALEDIDAELAASLGQAPGGSSGRIGRQQSKFARDEGKTWIWESRARRRSSAPRAGE